MQMNITKRTIWLTRHGESEFNVLGKLGGDAPLTESGRAYAKALNNFIRDYEEDLNLGSRITLEDSRESLHRPKLKVFTSTLQRAVQTADAFDSDFFDVSCIRYIKFLWDFNV